MRMDRDTGGEDTGRGECGWEGRCGLLRMGGPLRAWWDDSRQGMQGRRRGVHVAATRLVIHQIMTGRHAEREFASNELTNEMHDANAAVGTTDHPIDFPHSQP